MTYRICKEVIEKANYKSQEEKNDMQLKLDVFLLNNRIEQEEYEELTGLLSRKEISN